VIEVLLIRLMITNRPYTSLFIEEGGWTLYKLISRANSANLANNRSTKLGTLICSAHARAVWPTGVDRPALGPDRPPLKLLLNNKDNFCYEAIIYYIFLFTKRRILKEDFFRRGENTLLWIQSGHIRTLHVVLKLP
jgi:hypothetical protein